MERLHNLNDIIIAPPLLQYSVGAGHDLFGKSNELAIDLGLLLVALQGGQALKGSQAPSLPECDCERPSADAPGPERGG